MSKQSEEIFSISMESELKKILTVEADRRNVGLSTAIRDILWEYVNKYRMTSIYDVVFYMKQLFPEKNLTDKKIKEAAEKVLRSRKVNDNLELNGEEIEKLKVLIDVGIIK